MSRHMPRIVAILALSVALAACTGGQGGAAAADKAGAQTVVLHFATPDGNDNGQPLGPQAFLDSLAAVSGGRLKVDMTYGYDNGIASSEVDLIHAIANGQFDGGWPSVRSFANAGIHGLEAVEAPMTLTNYAAVKDLVSGPVAPDLLARLKGTGIVGVALAAGPLRRPFAATAPLLAPTDWQGIGFRSLNSPIQDATIRALGATPVHAGVDWTDAIATGQLRGLEFDVAQYATNDMTTEAPYVTANVVLWPKVFVITLGQARYDSLTDQQRGWILAAAAAATKATVDSPFDESAPAEDLCNVGVRFVDASPSQILALRNAVAPVIRQLAGDPVNSPLLAEIQAIAARHPGVDEPQVPAACRVATPPGPSPTIPAGASSLPAGTYRVQVTSADVTAAGYSNADGSSGTWTLKVGDGTFALSCRAIDQPGHDCGNISATQEVIVEAGDLRGADHTAYFVGDGARLAKLIGCLLPPSTTAPGHCNVLAPYWLDWTLNGDTLTFSRQGGGPAEHQYVVKPWTKIG